MTYLYKRLVDQLHADISHDCKFSEGWCSSYDKITQLVEEFSKNEMDHEILGECPVC
jgi:hypothetical protein